MLDQMFNHAYVIRVEYFVEENDQEVLKSMLFTSNYSAEDNFFKTYIKNRMQNEKNYIRLAEFPFKQTLIPLTNYCR